MSQRVGKRQLQFQLLERRSLLAGNVFVSVVDGDLRVDGDDQGNVVQLQQLSSSDPRAVRGESSFRVTPDADTSINRNEPGVEIVVAGVTRDIDVAMGGGGDELAVLGATGRQLRNLLIDAGGGPGTVSVTRFRLSQDISVSAADSLNLLIEQTRASDLSVKIDDIQGESKDAAAGSTSSVTIRNSRLRGNVNVSGDVPLAVKIHGTIVFPDVCKVPAPPAPFTPCGNVNISSGAPLSVAIEQTRASDLSVKIDDIQGESKDAAAGSTSSVTIRNSRLRGNVNVSGDVPLAVAIDQTRAGGDVSIKAEGILKSSGARSSGFANSIRIVDSVFGSLRIDGSELGDELKFVRLRVLSTSHIETGGGDDYLTAVDSVFVGPALLDGGDDNDSLILTGTLFRRGSKLVNWE